MSDVTRILNAIERGDAKATDELLRWCMRSCVFSPPKSYPTNLPGRPFRRLRWCMKAYIRLVGDEPQSWENWGHFFAAAAEAMRRILVDNARRKKSLKGGACSGVLNLMIPSWWASRSSNPTIFYH